MRASLRRWWLAPGPTRVSTPGGTHSGWIRHAARPPLMADLDRSDPSEWKREGFTPPTGWPVGGGLRLRGSAAPRPQRHEPRRCRLARPRNLQGAAGQECRQAMGATQAGRRRHPGRHLADHRPISRSPGCGAGLHRRSGGFVIRRRSQMRLALGRPAQGPGVTRPCAGSRERRADPKPCHRCPGKPVRKDALAACRPRPSWPKRSNRPARRPP